MFDGVPVSGAQCDGIVKCVLGCRLRCVHVFECGVVGTSAKQPLHYLLIFSSSLRSVSRKTCLLGTRIASNGHIALATDRTEIQFPKLTWHGECSEQQIASDLSDNTYV